MTLTFLQLCSRLRQEVGISGAGPIAVTGQTGELKRIVDWVLGAYEEIQNKHKNWKFLQNEFSFNTVSGTQAYALTDAALATMTELATWKRDDVRIYLTATGTSDETRLRYCPWENFKATYLFGASRATTGKPTHFSIKPDKSIVFWPKPDAIYTCVGEYFKRAQTMTANADEPLLPDEYHMLIVWQAIVTYAVYTASPEVYAGAKEKVALYMPKLELDQLPPLIMAGPLV